jgi:pyruvate,water dikinase
MTLTQVLGVLLIFLICPILGGLPLIQWITYRLTGQQLSQIGTGNIGVSAAFYHGGRLVGILAVLSEAFKGIAAVLLVRLFFPSSSVWEIIALIALVMGRYWIGRGAGTTNVVWGYVVHDLFGALLIFLVSGISFTILRERHLGRLAVLVLLPVITALLHPDDGALIGAMVTLSILLGWIYQKIPDDLDLSTESAQEGSRQMFQFFRGDRAILSLDQPLAANKVGQKAATLSQLKHWGYPVPMGWVLPPGDDPAPLIQFLRPSVKHRLAVRSSAIGEDTESASAAGQYESILNVSSQPALEQAILRCQASYSLPTAIQYRQDRGIGEGAMAVLVQEQVQGIFSGVAFSRDPIARQGDTVVIEALPGAANQVVSGYVTPEQYRVRFRDTTIEVKPDDSGNFAYWLLPAAASIEVEGKGEVPTRIIQQVAYMARHIEARYHGIPQDIEWSYDGHQLWLLQSRPITTLLPIWTRKIAAEVIPGFIHPLTWSINHPLTCGVWGEIFTIVLGDRASGLDFNETATLHHSAAYFNASLLGQIFLRMGLPPESLEFLTRGAKFSKPPIGSTLRNLPGLLKLLRRELDLEHDFNRDYQQLFQPELVELTQQRLRELASETVLARIEHILNLLKRATYYSILSPLSLALRQAVLQVNDAELDNSQTPEVASLRSLQGLANDARALLPTRSQLNPESSAIFEALAKNPDAKSLLNQFDQFLEQYGYLSEIATDIAVPRWQENSQPVRELFTQLVFYPPTKLKSVTLESQAWKAKQVQSRLDLKGRVTTIYSRLLAELRRSFVALEGIWLSSGLLAQLGDLFFLKFEEIQQLIGESNPELRERLPQLIAERRSQLQRDRQAHSMPILVYGNDPPILSSSIISSRQPSRQFQGIGASPGRVEGQVLVLHNFQTIPTIDQGTILVVPYTDSGWAPLLARAGGLITEVGGRLSHGAIIAREYGIPAVMDIHQATQQLQNGQQVRIDGEHGTVEILLE